MKFTHLAALVAGCSTATARGIEKRTLDYDVCASNCALAGTAIPDKDTFQLPLENNWSERCPPTFVGGTFDAPLAKSSVCLNFAGPFVTFNFAPFPGFHTKSAAVTWKLKGNNADKTTWQDPPPSATLACTSGSGGEYVCKLPFADILAASSTTSIIDLLKGICPNTDREALVLYLEFSGEVQRTTDGLVIPFSHQYPCATRASDGSCTAWQTRFSYIEVTYRCSTCPTLACPSSSTSVASTTSTSTTPEVSSTTSEASSTTSEASSTTSEASSSTSSAPPTLQTCSFGTAFGYQNPVSGVQKSFTLDTQSGAGCNRWGWYETPTLAELQGGISGPLYVGAGGNDITKAVDVGVWVATANAVGGVTVTYLLNPPYALSEVHVNLVCLPLTKCGPGQYTYNAGTIPNLPTWSNPTPLTYPTCSGGSRAVLVVHASVNDLTVTSACPPPKAS